MLDKLERLPPDPILGLAAAARADDNPDKVDLTVGIYMDEQGVCPVFNAVSKAQLALEQEEITKAYMPAPGAPEFNTGIQRLVMGAELPALTSGRVSTWLNTDMAPTYMKIYNVQILLVGGSSSPAPSKYPILHLQTSNINAFHLMPPFADGADYDPDEPNRKMVSVSAFTGYFRFDGFARMSEMNTLGNFLSSAKGDFITIYDTAMTCPLIPSIKGIKAPMTLFRQKQVAFSVAED